MKNDVISAITLQAIQILEIGVFSILYYEMPKSSWLYRKNVLCHLNCCHQEYKLNEVY